MFHSSLHRFQGCEGPEDPGIASGSFLPLLPTPTDRGRVAKAAPGQPQCPPHTDRPRAVTRKLLPHLTHSTVPYQPFPVRGWGNRSCRQTSRSAPGRPPLPRPALLSPPLQRQAFTATSRTRVRDCGKFQTACRALRKEEGAGAEQRERERAPDSRITGDTATHAGTGSHRIRLACVGAGRIRWLMGYWSYGPAWVIVPCGGLSAQGRRGVDPKEQHPPLALVSFPQQAAKGGSVFLCSVWYCSARSPPRPPSSSGRPADSVLWLALFFLQSLRQLARGQLA